jgi:DinB family protein
MVSEQLEQITQTVKREFGSLRVAEQNLKPADDKWSIAQCLDHLIVSNETYVPAFHALLNGSYRQTFWQTINPFTGFIGKKGLAFLKAGKTKLKAPAIFKPSERVSKDNVVDRFVVHQEKMKSLFDKMESGGFQDKIISSPVANVLTLKIGDVMNIIVEHELRHVKQALNVKAICIK